MTPHTQAAFVTSFVDREGRQPTPQEVWDAAIRSYRDLAQPASVPAGFVLAPHYRGYALLGTGRYLIDSTDAPAASDLGAELIISIATDADREGREIGERRDMPPRTIQPEAMAIRLGFANERGLFALEDQLWVLRQEHWPGTKSAAMLAASPQAPQPAQAVPMKGTLNLSDPAVQRRLAAQWGYVQGPAHAPDERDRLRAAQDAAVMPLIGPLLDAWEQADREVMDDEPELVKWLKAINTAMETAGEDQL